MNKIIIFGFPHYGTTILKSIIGHIDEVQEIIPECSYIDSSILACKNGAKKCQSVERVRSNI